ncbi:MAG: hypothetical protein AAF633_13000 [Chloroflexota bacterium]
MSDQNHTTSRSELEHLRDILYGDFARSAESRIILLEDHLGTFIDKTTSSLTEQDQHHSEQLTLLKTSIENQLAELTNEIRAELAVINNRLDRIEENYVSRFTLSEWLLDLGKQLQEKSS